MNGIRDLNREDFKKQLHKSVETILDLYEDIGDRKVYHSKDRGEVASLFDEGLPQVGADISSLIETIKDEIIPNVAIHYSPNFYAWVTSNATQASIIGELISTGLNVNATTWLNAPAASEVEQRVLKWIIEFIDYNLNGSGVLLSGGSQSNFTGLRVAISQKCPYDYQKQGFDRSRPLRIYTSEQNHFCLDKAIGSLGLGMDNLVKVKTDPDFKIDLQDLVSKIEIDLSLGCIPIAVVANTGTVNTGAVDPIFQLSQLCKKYDLWLHLDAAYGGFAASIPDYRKNEFKGLELADSITIDLHKWLFVPFECAALLVKDSSHLRNTFSFIPEYQRFDHEDQKVDFSEYSMQQSRNFKALKVWMNFKAYGAEDLKNSINHSIDLMNELGELISSSEDFELVTPVSLSIVCFRYVPTYKDWDDKSLNVLNKEIVQETEKDGRVFIRETILNDKVVLRACCTNFRRTETDTDFLIDVIREIGVKTSKRLNAYE